MKNFRKLTIFTCLITLLLPNMASAGFGSDVFDFACRHKKKTFAVVAVVGTYLWKNFRLDWYTEKVTKTVAEKSLNAISPKNKIPIVFNRRYTPAPWGTRGLLNILHPFPITKWQDVYSSLKNKLGLRWDQFYETGPASKKTLTTAHSKKYLNSLEFRFLPLFSPSTWINPLKFVTNKFAAMLIYGNLRNLRNYLTNENPLLSNINVALATEILPIAFVPPFLNFLVRWYLLDAFKYQTQGTILATELALKHGAAINIGGGFHHAKKDSGEGFCIYNDTVAAIRNIQKTNPDLKILIIDLDFHRGNGNESIFGENNETLGKNEKDYSKKIAFFDLYAKAYPPDNTSEYIAYEHEITKKIGGPQYLNLLKNALPTAINEFRPDFIFYNAGTDPYEKDKLNRGTMKLTKQDLVERDEFVFNCARKPSKINSLSENKQRSIVMVTSGGYSEDSASIIADSTENLWNKKLIKCVEV